MGLGEFEGGQMGGEDAKGLGDKKKKGKRRSQTLPGTHLHDGIIHPSFRIQM